MFDRTVFFRLVASRKATPFVGGQERNAICKANCKANCESGSMHPLSERDRVKKDYGKVKLKTQLSHVLQSQNSFFRQPARAESETFD